MVRMCRGSRSKKPIEEKRADGQGMVYSTPQQPLRFGAACATDDSFGASGGQGQCKSLGTFSDGASVSVIVLKMKESTYHSHWAANSPQ